MKNIYLIGGTMGVGKTTTCQILKNRLPNSVFLDGDWCWDMQPFQVTPETKKMVMENIRFLLNQFIHCSVYENIIFCWVMHEQAIIDDVLVGLKTEGCLVHTISLICDEDELRKRLQKDVDAGIRSADVIQRSVARIDLYGKLDTEKIDVSHITPEQAAERIIYNTLPKHKIGKEKMENIRIETKRLTLRRFEEKDMEAIYLLLSDEEVNTFLPWFPIKDMKEARHFFEKRLKDKRFCFAICLKDEDYPVGYVNVEDDDSHDFGYALRKEYWHQGIASEASNAVIELLKEEGIPYITATHDKNNPKSGIVMKRIGMKYCYSYKEQWQPKAFPVIFRMYQLNLDGQKNRVYQKYWNQYDEHFIEPDI